MLSNTNECLYKKAYWKQWSILVSGAFRIQRNIMNMVFVNVMFLMCNAILY